MGAISLVLWVIEQIWPSYREMTPSQTFTKEIGFGKPGVKVDIDDMVELDRLIRAERRTRKA